jgi:hypothetical protein
VTRHPHTGWYRLIGRLPVPCTAEEGHRALEDAQSRRVASDMIMPGLSVSTVFLALDHSMFDGEPPVLFETLVFSDEESGETGEQRRYTSWAEAEAGHAEVVASLRAQIADAEASIPTALKRKAPKDC